MDVKQFDDPGEFLEVARPLLLEDEARHNLMLGVAGTLRDQRDVYPTYELLVAERGGAVAAASLRTPPFNVLVAGDEAAVVRLAEALHDQKVEPPGVTAALPEADVFAARWAELAAVTPEPRVRQGIYRLRELRPPPAAPGAARAATEADRELLVAWVTAFSAEVHGWQPGRDAAEAVDARLTGGGFTLWEVDGQTVSLAGWGSPTPNGIRIGPVYTPPEHRGRGYGSAVTAAASAEQLAAGRTFCFLYTDLANPTSNKIYAAMGYEPVCDSVEYVFTTR